MSESAENKVTAAATAVMKALEPLSAEDRARVLQSAAALHGIGLPAASNRPPDPSNIGGAEDRESGDSKGKRQSLVELLREKDPVTNTQRLATFAFYREHVEKKAHFARGDLEPYFAIAKLSKPGNYDRDFAAAVRDGLIHEDGSESYLTQRGEDAVREGFAGKAKPRGAPVAKKK